MPQIHRKCAFTRLQGNRWLNGKTDLRSLFLAHDGAMYFTLCLFAILFPVAKNGNTALWFCLVLHCSYYFRECSFM